MRRHIARARARSSAIAGTEPVIERQDAEFKGAPTVVGQGVILLLSRGSALANRKRLPGELVVESCDDLEREASKGAHIIAHKMHGFAQAGVDGLLRDLRVDQALR